MLSNIETIATQLTIRFTEENLIPLRFKKDLKNKQKKDTIIERNFKASVAEWKKTICTLLSYIEETQAKRFITISPYIEEGISNVTENKDFNQFLEYLIKRRDNDNCEDIELGHLAMLHTAFQNEIEQKIQGSSNKTEELIMKSPLKNNKAQKLREQGQVTVDGIQVNLWQNHSFDNVSIQDQWNKVKSYADLNQNTTGENGKIVISGVLQISRQEALECATKLGFNVHNNISKKTNYMILGSENVSPSKLAKAMELNENGAEIQFIDEMTFLEMLAENLN